MRTYKHKPGSRLNKNYTTEDLQYCLKRIEDGEMSIARAAAVYKIPRTTLQDKVRGRHATQPNAGHPKALNIQEE